MAYKQDNFKTLFYLIIYRLVLDFVYIYQISPNYSYSGLTLNMNGWKYVLSLFLQVVLIYSMKIDLAKTSTYLYLFLHFFLVVPTLSFYALNNMSTVYILYLVLCCLILSFVLKGNFKKAPTLEVDSMIILRILFFVYTFVAIVLIFKRGGIDIRAFDFDTVYELRVESNIKGVWGYLLNWCAKAFSPFFFSYAVFKKNKIMQVSVLLIQCLLYLSFGNKAFLFSIFAVVGISYLVKRKNFIKKFSLTMTLSLLISFVMDKYFFVDTLRRAIPYRMLYIPSQIQFQYYDFFVNREKMHFSESVFGKLLNINSVYDIPVPILISRYYSGNVNLLAFSNTGLFSDAYSNGGLIAMILITILFGLILLLIDCVTPNVPVYISVSSLSYIMFVINDTSLFTTLLTGGLGIMIVLLYLFNSLSTPKNELMKMRSEG